ncbi:hypothetical protein C8R43DRAFT_1138126 [Mycena crocata]|nr:hypothetical protein C8R43DRAFT_1138126 [Mycena crocata]
MVNITHVPAFQAFLPTPSSLVVLLNDSDIMRPTLTPLLADTDIRRPKGMARSATPILDTENVSTPISRPSSPIRRPSSPLTDLEDEGAKPSSSLDRAELSKKMPPSSTSPQKQGKRSRQREIQQSFTDKFDLSNGKDLHRSTPWSQQPHIEVFRNRMHLKFPELKNFEKDWALQHLTTGCLKYSKEALEKATTKQKLAPTAQVLSS